MEEHSAQPRGQKPLWSSEELDEIKEMFGETHEFSLEQFYFDSNVFDIEAVDFASITPSGTIEKISIDKKTSMMSKTVTEEQVDSILDDYLVMNSLSRDEAMILLAGMKARGGQRQGNPNFALGFAEVSG